jgi:hypothetical protein
MGTSSLEVFSTEVPEGSVLGYFDHMFDWKSIYQVKTYANKRQTGHKIPPDFNRYTSVAKASEN